MENWHSVKLLHTASLIDAIKIIDANALQIAIVVDNEDKMIGTITDGDIRRAILNEISFYEPVTRVLNSNFHFVTERENRDNILRLMKSYRIKQMPVLTEEKKVIGLYTIEDFLEEISYDNWVILMAGGTGKRLGELTRDCPKPLIPVGGKPLLETIIENFNSYGFHKIFLSVNYKADLIEKHFLDGSRLNVNIEYLRETKKLGTAGALSILPTKPRQPIIVMNGDILTKINFQQLLEFHNANKALATMCVREYSFQVPYGVISSDNCKLTKIIEKPVHNFFISAGIYVLEPEVLDWIPRDTCFDMPSLFEKIMENNKVVTVFPIREYWIDIGQYDDLARANCEYGENFG